MGVKKESANQLKYFESRDCCKSPLICSIPFSLTKHTRKKYLEMTEK